MTMNAVVLNRALWGLLAVLVLTIGVSFYYASHFLGNAVVSADHARIDAEISAQNVTKLKQLQTELANQVDIVDRTRQIIAESQQYQYQDQIIRDINTYAVRTGVTVTGYQFVEADKKTKKPATAGPRLKGVKALTATVNLAAPVDYTNFLRFLKAIEQNLTKMQVTGVNVTPDVDNPNAVSNPSVGLKVYVKD